jgi:hypothetical protein
VRGDARGIPGQGIAQRVGALLLILLRAFDRLLHALDVRAHAHEDHDGGRDRAEHQPQRQRHPRIGRARAARPEHAIRLGHVDRVRPARAGSGARRLGGRGRGARRRLERRQRKITVRTARAARGILVPAVGTMQRLAQSRSSKEVAARRAPEPRPVNATHPRRAVHRAASRARRGSRRCGASPARVNLAGPAGGC